MILEVQNPSDAITLETDNIIAAGIGIALISRCQYGLENEQGETVFPICMFGGFEDWLKRNAVDDLDSYITTHRLEMAAALESVLYGSIESRKLFYSAVEKMTPENAAIFRAEWNEQKRTSMNNIGHVCNMYAQKLRKLESPKN